MANNLIDLHTFDQHEVPAIADARLYDFLANGESGIFTGVDVTIAGGLILYITDGWGMIKGRVFTINAGNVTATPSTSGTLQGRLLVQLDISNIAEPISFITQAAAVLPELIQEDINAGGTIYQLPIATYTVTEVAVANLVNIIQQLKHVANNGFFEYTQNGSNLIGTGKNGEFKASATAIYSAFSIDGTSFAVKNGDENSIEIISGNWYSFILDKDNNTINFKSGGGVTNSKLALATAAANEVLQGETFYSGDKTLKTGTIPKKAAATYGAKTSAQTIEAGQYLDGAQTIAAVTQSGLSAANIVSGKTVTIASNGSNLWSVAGSYAPAIVKLQEGSHDYPYQGATQTYTYTTDKAYKNIIVAAHSVIDKDTNPDSPKVTGTGISRLTTLTYGYRSGDRSNHLRIYIANNVAKGVTFTVTFNPGRDGGYVIMGVN